VIIIPFSDFLSGQVERLERVAYPYHEVIIDTPAVITPTTSAKQLTQGSAYKWVFSFIIRVESMGTATYIKVGSYLQQNYRLIVVGQTITWAGNPGEVCDISKLFVISDTSDATLELIAAYVPLHLVGLVEQGVGMNL
jgi:hypothetical protein